jgi:hypothetical protein
VEKVETRPIDCHHVCGGRRKTQKEGNKVTMEDEAEDTSASKKRGCYSSYFYYYYTTTIGEGRFFPSTILLLLLLLLSSYTTLEFVDIVRRVQKLRCCFYYLRCSFSCSFKKLVMGKNLLLEYFYRTEVYLLLLLQDCQPSVTTAKLAEAFYFYY